MDIAQEPHPESAAQNNGPITESETTSGPSLVKEIFSSNQQLHEPPPVADAKGDEPVDPEHAQKHETNDQNKTMHTVADHTKELIDRPLATPTEEDAQVPEEWIDRTNEPLGEIGKGYSLSPTLTSLYLTNNRLKEIANLDQCRLLREVVLRQNAISVVNGLHTLGELEELDLYMNQIKEIPPTTFQQNPKLKKLDLSFNQLRTLQTFPSENLPNLEELYLIGNRIKVISPLRGMHKLVMLELGDNQIRVIENLEGVGTLEGLWLGRNKITRIGNLEPLVHLRRLSLQSNRIETIEGLSHLRHLEELYLSHNGIKSMKGVEMLTNLRVLDLSVNFIEHVEGVENLNLLQEFWMNGNKLESIEGLRPFCDARELKTVYLEGNPLARDPEYQEKILDMLPDSLEQLDALLVEDVQKEIAKRKNVAQNRLCDASDQKEIAENG